MNGNLLSVQGEDGHWYYRSRAHHVAHWLAWTLPSLGMVLVAAAMMGAAHG